MEELPITRAYLESLTTGDLISIADDLGVDIPSGLDRVFIIGEILEITSLDSEPENLTESGTENGLIDTVLVEAAPLPKQYNISFLEVMIRDPLWAFVFWEIKSQDREQIEKSEDFGGYYLKVSPLKKENNSQAEAKEFRIPVKPDDIAWYLGLSPVVFGGISPAEQIDFTIDFCADMKGEETVLVSSRPVKLPELPNVAGEHEDNPLVSLSGYAEFHIIRNTERLQRQKKAEIANE